MHKAYINWSGGKDAALALYRVQKETKLTVNTLLTSVNAIHNRISMHGVRRSLLEAQAYAMNMFLTTVELPEQPHMCQYEEIMSAKIAELKAAGYTHSIFGDIFLEDLKLYRENKLKEAGVQGVFPLWKTNSSQLINELLNNGFKAIVVCVNEQLLDKRFCGRLLNEAFINDLPPGVDICGENGEFHTFVFDGPLFKQPIPIVKGDLVYRQYTAPKTVSNNCHESLKNNPPSYGFWFCDLLLK
jgi:uncharacterized protein (TIGR00290 family)